MELYLVRYFVTIVDHGTVAKAAHILYVSQPSLNQAVQTLENRLGTVLFDRAGGRWELTAAGRRFEVAARRILADVEQAKSAVAQVRELHAGGVDVAVNADFRIDPLVPVIARFRERYPALWVRVVDVAAPAGVTSALRAGEAEIGVAELSDEQQKFTEIPVGTQELVLAAAPELLGGLTGSVPRERVRSLPLVIDHGDRTTKALLADMIDTDAKNVAVDCAHPPAIWALVNRGVGATVLSRGLAAQQLPGARVLSLDPPLHRQWGLVTRAECVVAGGGRIRRRGRRPAQRDNSASGKVSGAWRSDRRNTSWPSSTTRG